MGMKNTGRSKRPAATQVAENSAEYQPPGPRSGGPLAESLKTRTWPRNPEGTVVEGYENSPWVKTGRVFTRALRMHQQISEPIPDGESAITSLCVGANGKIYGATSGKRSHLFFYDPAPTGDGVVDLGVLEGVTDVRRCLAAVGSAIYIGASASTDPRGGSLYVHDTTPDYTDEFRAYKGAIKRLAIPVKGEGIAALIAAPGEAILYGISSVTGTFFEYDIDSGKVEQFGRVSKDAAFSRALVADGKGFIYGTHSFGTLFRFSPFTRTVDDLQLRIPSVAGREYYNRLDSAVYDPSSRLIYGAGTGDGILFRLDPDKLEVRSLGKVIAEPRVRALTLANDGALYGIAGCEEGMGHLFRYDPRHSELQDLGIMLAASEVWRRGFEFDAACTGVDGTLYFGESERDASLFLYFPAQPAPPARRPEYDYDDIPF